MIVCAPKGIAAQVQAKLKGYTWNLVDAGAIVYEIREIQSEQAIKVFEVVPPLWDLKEVGMMVGNTIFDDSSFVVSCLILDHKTPSIAYQFKERDTIKIDLTKSNFGGGSGSKNLRSPLNKN